MTLYRLCPQCGAKGERSGLCDECRRKDNRRRNEKRKKISLKTCA